MFNQEKMGFIGRTACLSIIAFAVTSGAAQAQGGTGGGGTANAQGSGVTGNVRGVPPTVTHAGTCTMPDGSVAPDLASQAKLIKSQGIWFFSMETTGANSAGQWTISFYTNGVGEPAQTADFPPPGGWSVVGGEIAKGAAKGIYTFRGVATKITQSADPTDASVAVGAVCDVTISKKI